MEFERGLCTNYNSGIIFSSSDVYEKILFWGVNHKVEAWTYVKQSSKVLITYWKLILRFQVVYL